MLRPSSLLEESKVKPVTPLATTEIKPTPSSVSSAVLPVEGNGIPIRFTQISCKNWGGTIEINPSYTFFPKTEIGVTNIVKWANTLNKKIRVVGFKHTWTRFYPKRGDILISYKEREGLITPSELDPKHELEHIELIGKPFEEKGKLKHLCKIGAATTNQQLRAWAEKSFESGEPYSWVLPMNVVLVENTLGGTINMMCHGAGVNNPTLSDTVTSIRFVNPRGEIQNVGYDPTDPEEKTREGRELIKTAAGSFGIIGPVLTMTCKLDLLTHAVMYPLAPRLALTVPPPADYEFTPDLPKDIMKGVTSEQLALAKKDFTNRCKNHYYTEFFHFVTSKKGWINSFENNGAPEESKSYPTKKASVIQELQQYTASLAYKSIMKLAHPLTQAVVLSEIAMFVLPKDKRIVTPLSSAYHFRHGIDQLQVGDMEIQIPIPPKENGEPDFEICQKAWWDGITIFYKWLNQLKKVPMRLPLEMRIMAGSEMTMAAQKGNTHGTCSIEVLTLGPDSVNPKEWLAFMQEVLDKWSSYTDYTGKPLNIRPHWAKQHEGLTIQRKGLERKPIQTYLKEEAYKDAIPVFKNDLRRIAALGGFSSDEFFNRFSTPYLDYLFLDDEKTIPPVLPASSSLPKKEVSALRATIPSETKFEPEKKQITGVTQVGMFKSTSISLIAEPRESEVEKSALIQKSSHAVSSLSVPKS